MLTKFMAISTCKNQLGELKEFLEKLRVCQYPEEYMDFEIRACALSIRECSGKFLLTGQYYTGNGFDLDFWCREDDCQRLLQNLIYLESRANSTFVCRYYPCTSRDGSHILGEARVFIDLCVEELLPDIDDFPAELLDPVCSYFSLTARE